MRANLASFEAVCVEDVTVALVAFLGFHVFFFGGYCMSTEVDEPYRLSQFGTPVRSYLRSLNLCWCFFGAGV